MFTEEIFKNTKARNAEGNMQERAPSLSKGAILDISKNKLGGLGHHYGGAGGCGCQNFSILIIEQVTIGDQAMLADREAYWQHQLRCYVENGGNGHCYRKEV